LTYRRIWVRTDLKIRFQPEICKRTRLSKEDWQAGLQFGRSLLEEFSIIPHKWVSFEYETLISSIHA